MFAHGDLTLETDVNVLAHALGSSLLGFVMSGHGSGERIQSV